MRRSRNVLFAIGKVEREGEHFRATLTPKASTGWQGIETEKVSAWVGILPRMGSVYS